MLAKSTQANAFLAFTKPWDRSHHVSPQAPQQRRYQGALLGGSRGTLRRLTSVADASPAATVQEQDKKPVIWTQQWWPVQFEQNLETDRPNRIQLLGRWFVAWKGKSGDWIVMDDVCAHRLAPLSEGRIEDDGNLLCAYHAWRFDENGKCVAIPQADDDKARIVACSSLRSRVQKYPCKAYGSLLWVWPDDAPAAIIDAAATPIPMPAYLAESLEKRAEKNLPTGYTRVLPYGYDVLVENLFDPAHVVVAHHGLFGSSRYDARALNARQDEPLDNPHKANTVLSFEYDSLSTGGWAHVEYTLPGFVEYRGGASRDGERWIGQFLYTVPLAAGKSRAFTFGGSNALLKGGLGFLPLPMKLFPWLLCINFHNLFDGDSVFLRIQDIQLGKTNKKTGQSGWRNYYMPTSADIMTASFRRWFETEGGGGPDMPKGQSESKTSADDQREMVLDRYSQHTKECKVCQKGMAFMDRVVAVSQACMAMCCLGLFVGGPSSSSLWKWLMGGLAGVLLRTWAKKEKQKFHFVDYVHAEHD
ncbi:hypothetical protein BSKO_08172 [Bryopsis sp. KO-2023]|nr:hypothetical protein BSKO_08172 [Bryopsis sp. KO-2023]